MELVTLWALDFGLFSQDHTSAAECGQHTGRTTKKISKKHLTFKINCTFAAFSKNYTI